MLKFFAEKMWVAFAVQKLLTFFQQKNIRILYIESAKAVNKMTLNELVKLTTLWTTGPWSLIYIRSLLCIAPHKMLFFFNQNVLIFFLFLHKNVCSVYSLEAPCQGACKEYHNICFHGEIRKIFIWYPHSSRPMALFICVCNVIQKQTLAYMQKINITA